MKRFLTFVSLFFLLFSDGGLMASVESLWRDVREAEEKKLPKTAIEHLDRLIILSRDQGRKGDFVKAWAKKVLNQAEIMGSKPEEKVAILQKEIDQSDPAVKPMLKLILAVWYWHYYSENSYKFQGRSQTEGMDDADFTTWDLPKLFRHIAGLFDELLQSESLYSSMLLSEFSGLYQPGNLPDVYCKTVFEFFVREAIRFHSEAISVFPAPQDAFVIDSNTDAFAELSTFLRYEPEKTTTDKSSSRLQALILYRRLLDLLVRRGEADPIIDTDLQRLRFVVSRGVGGNRQELFEARLLEIADRYAPAQNSTMALYELANIEYKRENFLKSLDFCEEALRRFPDSRGGQLCHNLKQRIFAKSFDIKMEHTVTEANNTLQVNYRNVEKLYYRVVEDQWDRGINQEWANINEYLSEEIIADLLRKKPVKSGTFDLPPTTDYKQKNIELPLPEMPFGYYRILVSEHSNFRDNSDNQVLYAGFWSTNTMLLLRSVEREIQLMVLNATTGQPLSDQRVQVYQRDRRGRYLPFQTLNTDSEGIMRMQPAGRDRYPLLFFVEAETGSVSFHQPHNFAHPRTLNPSSRTVFFTDRAIYRPGQLVQFKGICTTQDPGSQRYEVLANQRVRVSFRDPNYQELDQAEFVTNEFGSFNGQFTAPTGTLTGSMQLVASNPSGNVSFRVEEYKRPKFEVLLEALDQEFRLNEEVKMKGSAKTFSGVAVSAGRVKFRVKRQVRLPWWWRWHNPFQGSQEIAHGESSTDESGNFTISFKAKPDLSVPPETDPSFEYEVSVDVIDSTGETRSKQRSVRIGYSALEARLSLPEWLDAAEPLPFRVQVNTLDGQPLKNAGKVEIYSLKQPVEPVRKPGEGRSYYYRFFEKNSGNTTDPDLSDYANWEKDRVVQSFEYNTAENGQSLVEKNVAPGAYKAVLTTRDMYGKEIKSEIAFAVFSRQKQFFPVKVPAFFRVKNTTVEPGGYLEAVFATGYENASVYVAYLREGRRLPGSGWKMQGQNFINMMMKVPEELRGGFTLELLFVRDNQVYAYRQFITVPWVDKKLKLSFETFRNKLRPNEQETWTVKIEGHDAQRAVAELVATLYDASLDTFVNHAYSDFSGSFFTDYTAPDFRRNLFLKSLLTFSHYQLRNSVSVRSMEYPSLPYEIRNDFSRFFPPVMLYRNKGMHLEEGMMFSASVVPGAPMKRKSMSMEAKSDDMMDQEIGGGAIPEEKESAPEVEIRTNLNETAFFMPALVSTEDGVVSLSFTMPEALTRWKFLAMAHDEKLRSGLLSTEIVTQKELMVEPNLPRFLRQGDQIYLSAKVSNMSEQVQEGAIELKLLEAVEDRSISDLYNLQNDSQDFSIKPGGSKAFFFQVRVPDLTEPLRYRFVARSAKFADGEEGLLPVLSRRILVRESLPLWISGRGQKNFNFTKLLESAGSDTIQHEKLVVQMTSNPAWYAVQALPYLSKFPHECTDQIFNRFYANNLGRMIANSNPRIERIFQQWKGTDALLSNLQKNEDLKSVLLAETPWVLEAKDEAKSKNELAVFFDRNRMENELTETMRELVKRQDSGGGWPWMPGFKPNFFITNYIAAGFGRLRHLGITIDSSAALKAYDYLDNELRKDYEYLKKHGYLDQVNYGSEKALYLYGRSFFLNDRNISAANREAFDYFVAQAEKHWNKLDNRMSEAHTGLALLRLNKPVIPNLILKSLRERSRNDEELGMFWSDTELSYWWYRAPIETQALMIEYFSEMAPDTDEVERLQMWLLKQKQTQHWKTNKATADAVYALLLRGRDLLSEKQPVTVELGGQLLRPEKVEAGTGYWEKRFTPAEIRASMGEIKITKVDDGIAWGGVFWQYFEDIAKITPHESPLKMTKRLYIREMTKSGPVIKPYEKEELRVGDSLIVRVVLRTDRDMEYVHMKDMRGSGTEPVNVLSARKYQDGLVYYESTKDTATHFYFDYLPKGTYVFEYELKVFHRGVYESGMVEAQCLYAPEFNAHSESFLLHVKE
jgi:uncharacterized protein YfaS (alpha-2-macroglobulin family)